MHYIGRFAPSPTGPLHFGSLLAAVASYCDAKSNQGKWLLRIEDLDKPRVVADSAYTILQQLAAFGFEWDEQVSYQSQRTQYYVDALEQLQNLQLIYPCTCTRKEIADSSAHLGIDGLIYPQTCLKKLIKAQLSAALRLKVKPHQIQFNDAIQGIVQQNLSQAVGDFVIKRADGLFTYQLAVVVDDAMQGVTHVVRGADLLNSTPRQIYVQQQLGLPSLQYAHIPIARNSSGEKLSKQTLAQAIDIKQGNLQIRQALEFLGQQPTTDLQSACLPELWRWAIQHWNIQAVPTQVSTF